MQNKAFSKIWIFFVIVFLIGGVLAYKFIPRITILAPEAALAQSIERLKTINSLSIFSLTKFSPSSSEFLVNPFTLRVEGDLDKEHLDLDIEFEEKTENVETYLKSKVLLFEEEMYILFSEARQQGFSFSSYSSLASKLQEKPEVLGEWMKVNFEQALKEKIMDEEGVEQFQKAFAPDLFPNLKDILPQLLSRQSEEDVQLISEAEKLDGISTYHFQIELDREDIEALLIGVDSSVSTEQIEAIETAIINYWIDRKEALPIKITYQFFFKGGIEYYREYKISNYNQKFSFEKPTTYLDLVEKLKEEAEVSPIKAKARDASRQVDLRQIVTAMEMYYTQKDKYFQSKIIPTSIGIYMREIPKDPLTDKPYGWLDNTFGVLIGCDDQHYCFWVELEGGGYYVASEKGTKELSVKPINCPCW